MEKIALYKCPVVEPVPVSPWPNSHPEVILEVSDTDDSEGDYDSDDDME